MMIGKWGDRPPAWRFEDSLLPRIKRLAGGLHLGNTLSQNGLVSDQALLDKLQLSGGEADHFQ